VLQCSYVSSPGKVLIAGGYLVLERENIGITIATNARFFVRTELQNRYPSSPATSAPTSTNTSKIVFEFLSPQFRKICVYSFDFDTCATVLVRYATN
jgi:phosphomevalonate kinase